MTTDTRIVWEHDPEPWDGCEPYDGPLYGCILYRGETVVASLWGIAVPDTSDPYCREIEQELREEFESQRESVLIRGES